eukprot:754827-Hanusia_phi.AAC.13
MKSAQAQAAFTFGRAELSWTGCAEPWRGLHHDELQSVRDSLTSTASAAYRMRRRRSRSHQQSPMQPEGA